jgi:chromosome segregation ATPase
MPDPESPDITTQVLIQIRDDMRSMRSSFNMRFDAMETRMGALETGVDLMGGRMEKLDSRLKALEERIKEGQGSFVDLAPRMSGDTSGLDRPASAGASSQEDIPAAMPTRLHELEQTVYALGMAIDLLGERIGGIKAQGSRIEQNGVQLTGKIDLLQTQVDFLQGRIDVMEVRLDSLDDRADERFQELLSRFGSLDVDLKRFASVSNAAILHYADEMDKVRDRVTRLETNLP